MYSNDYWLRCAWEKVVREKRNRTWDGEQIPHNEGPNEEQIQQSWDDLGMKNFF